MRLSVDKDDRGHYPLAFAAGVEITLNGEPVKNCLTADTDLGLVVCADFDGVKPWMDSVPTIERRGKVEITRNGAPITDADMKWLGPK
jgi:hypothetical protein